MHLDEWVHVLPTLQLFHYVGHQGLLKGFGLFALQMATYVVIFTPMGLIVHHSGAAWHEGMEGGELDFGRHSIAATTDHSIALSNGTFWGHYCSLMLFGYLNDHTAHHLFPSIDHSKHYLYREIMLRTFQEFHIDYNSGNVLKLLYGLQQMIRHKKTTRLTVEGMQL